MKPCEWSFKAGRTVRNPLLQLLVGITDFLETMHRVNHILTRKLHKILGPNLCWLQGVNFPGRSHLLAFLRTCKNGRQSLRILAIRLFHECPLAPTVCLALSSALERWGNIQADSFLEAISWPQFPKAGLHSGPSHPSCSGAGMCLPPQELLQEPDCYPENHSNLLSVWHAGCFAGRERDLSQLKNIPRIQKRTF